MIWSFMKKKMYIRPRSGKEAFRILERAVDDMREYAMSCDTSYNNFWTGVYSLKEHESRFCSQLVETCEKNKIVEFAFNTLCPMIERLLREPRLFEKGLEMSVSSPDKYVQHVTEVKMFFQGLSDAAQVCVQRKGEVDESLSALADATRATLGQDAICQEPLKLMYVSNDKCRVLMRVMEQKVFDTFRKGRTLNFQSSVPFDMLMA